MSGSYQNLKYNKSDFVGAGFRGIDKGRGFPTLSIFGMFRLFVLPLTIFSKTKEFRIGKASHLLQKKIYSLNRYSIFFKANFAFILM
jgi:hypothetical protein